MSLTLAPKFAVSDQARVLRELIDRHSTLKLPGAKPACRAVAVVSGKGGVGKSVLSLNLAVSIAQQGHAVCLVDANPGLGSLDLLCGLSGYWNVSHVITGARELKDVVLRGPAGIELVPGASALVELAHCPDTVQAAVADQFVELTRRHEMLIIDAGSGHERTSRRFALAADQLLIVTTPEPTPITDAYATVKAYCAAGPETAVVVNRAESPDAANRIGERLRHTAQVFLQAEVDAWGWIPSDPVVAESVMARRPFLMSHPQSSASKSVDRLAQRCLATRFGDADAEPYFRRYLGNSRI